MKYKVGDKVTVRRDLELSQTSPSVNGDMLEYRGKTFCITSVDSWYRSHESGGWAWADWMLEDADPNIELFNSLK